MPWRSSEIIHAVDAFTLISRSRTVVSLVGSPHPKNWHLPLKVPEIFEFFKRGFPVEKWRTLLRCTTSPLPDFLAPRDLNPRSLPKPCAPADAPQVVKLAKKDGPLRQKQVRKFLQSANMAREIPDIFQDIGRAPGQVSEVLLRTGLTPPAKMRRTPAPPSPAILNADDDGDSRSAAWLTSDLLHTREGNSKFTTFIQGHKPRAMRAMAQAKQWEEDTPTVVVELVRAGEKDQLAREVAEYDRKIQIIRKRENTALDSEDEEWDESDLVS